MTILSETLDNYTDTSYKICIVLYCIGLLYALWNVLIRNWADNSRIQALMEQERSRLPALIVSIVNRMRLGSIPRNFCFALTLRIIWLVIKLDNIASGDPYQCMSLHTVFSACNRLAQLIFFTACTAVVGFWLTTIRNFQARQHNRAGLAEETLLSSAIAQSTTRRLPQQAVVTVPDISGIDNEEAISAKRLGFGALICSLLSPDMLQLLLNFWMYVIVVGLHIVQFFECNPVISRRIDSAETGVIAVFYFVLSIMYVVYGYTLVRMVSRLHHPVCAKLMRNTICITVVCSTTFLMNGILRSLDPIFDARVSGTAEKILYPWFILPIPELIPSIIIMFLMAPVPKRVTPGPSMPLVTGPNDDGYATISTNPSTQLAITDNSQNEQGNRFWV